MFHWLVEFVTSIVTSECVNWTFRSFSALKATQYSTDYCSLSTKPAEFTAKLTFYFRLIYVCSRSSNWEPSSCFTFLLLSPRFCWHLKTPQQEASCRHNLRMLLRPIPTAPLRPENYSQRFISDAKFFVSWFSLSVSAVLSACKLILLQDISPFWCCSIWQSRLLTIC